MILKVIAMKINVVLKRKIKLISSNTCEFSKSKREVQF